MKNLLFPPLISTAEFCTKQLTTLTHKLNVAGAKESDESALNSKLFIKSQYAAARYLHVGYRSLSRYIKQGFLKPVHYGNYWYYKISELDSCFELIPYVAKHKDTPFPVRNSRPPSIHWKYSFAFSGYFVYYVTYLTWKGYLCLPNDPVPTSEMIGNLSAELVKQYHVIHPFYLDPNGCPN